MARWSDVEVAAPELAGTAVEVHDPERRHALLGATADTGAHLFRLEVTEVVTVRVADDATHLLLTVWTPDGGLRTLQRG